MNKFSPLTVLLLLLIPMWQTFGVGMPALDISVDNCDTFTEDQKNLIKIYDGMPVSLLMRSAERGDLALARYAIEQGAEVNSTEEYFDALAYTPLFKAAYHGHIEMIDYLISQGAYSEFINLENTTLSAAVSGGHLDVVKWVVERKLINLHPQSTRAARSIAHLLVIAASGGHLPVLEWLVKEQGMRVSKRSRLVKSYEGRHRTYYTVGERALMNVTFQVRESLSCVQFLAQQGVNLHIETELGGNILFYAIISGSLKTLQWLAHQGLALDTRNKQGETLLHEAAKHFNLEIVTWLVEHGANVCAVDNQGRTARAWMEQRLPEITDIRVRSIYREVINFLMLAQQQTLPAAVDTPDLPLHTDNEQDTTNQIHTPTSEPSATTHPLDLRTEQEPWYGSLTSVWRTPEDLARLYIGFQLLARHRMASH